MQGAASPYGAWGQPGGIDTIGLLLNALQQRQIPPLPGPSMQPAAVPQQNALALLSMVLSNPHLQRTFQNAHAMGMVPRSVQLPVPSAAVPGRRRQVQIPLGAVMNVLTALAGEAMTELNESTPEDDPEVPPYLVGDDGDFLVDPASSSDRAALVAHLFRLSDEAERAGYGADESETAGEDETAAEDETAGDLNAEQEIEVDPEIDESEAWAEDAGFI